MAEPTRDKLIWFLLSIIILLVGAAWKDMSSAQTDMKSQIQVIQNDIGGKDGIRERLRALEAKP